ncbi:MAG: hypothetical protein CXT69_00310 [Methanobacteriota archaeon]|jgi:hypothetical protein|nr:MAG: hypothetical protein CXT69_00310 [Euryarchaeota archaeon]
MNAKKGHIQRRMPPPLIMAIERLLTGSIRDQVKDLIQTEDLILEAMRDLVKDELKNYIRSRIDDNPELKADIKEAISYYFNAKAKTLYAELKASHAAARLGIALLPDELQGEVGNALVSLFEKELGNVLDRAL